MQLTASQATIQLAETGPLKAIFGRSITALWLTTPDFYSHLTLLQRRAAEGEAGFYQECCWYGSEKRFDTNGNEWERSVGPFVTNDFGDLVQVPGLRGI